nr:MAG TPA_asm: hypothetical protein [Caudoviricetes sp.]
MNKQRAGWAGRPEEWTPFVAMYRPDKTLSVTPDTPLIQLPL